MEKVRKMNLDRLLYGAEYYDEYMPYDRLDKDVEMMKAAGFNFVRIGESTWSTYEPQEGVFDFSHVTRVLDAMEEAGISVCVGTPTYAVPTWLAKSHPEVLAVTKAGPGRYGARQIMDITNPAYLFYAERIIRKLMEVTAGRKCVIGFQVDNETSYYGTAGKNVQERFIKYLREKFHDDLDALNHEFGLDYWSNRINAWEDFPDVRGTINGSLGAEFEKFQRSLVDDFLAWQVKIVEEYARDDQFITQNFCFWGGIHPAVNYYKACRPMSVASVDVYHTTQDDLNGMEIAYYGDIGRSLKMDNYLVMETEAQGYPCWTPYEGQLRLQAFANIASGANMVHYWHWSSLHNGCETYWRGVLGHDFEENDTYRAAKVIGAEFQRLGRRLVNLKKKNRAAMLISHEALTALNWFPIDESMNMMGGNTHYNEVVNRVYNQLYRLNVECDILWPESEHMEDYDLIVVPALYAAPEELLNRLDNYVKNGGHLFATFKTGFANENVKVYSDRQPHILHRCLGVSYHQFTFPRNVKLSSQRYRCEDREAGIFMELLEPETAEVLAMYDHYNWKRYAAVTRNRYGKGSATYLGCSTSDGMLREILADVIRDAGLWTPDQEVKFPVIIKRGRNDFGNEIVYYLNFSPEPQRVKCCGSGTELFGGTPVAEGDTLVLGPWNLQIIERNKVQEIEIQ